MVSLHVCLIGLILLMYVSMPPLPMNTLKMLHGNAFANMGWLAISMLLTQVDFTTSLGVLQMMLLGNLQYRQQLYVSQNT